MRDVIRRRRWRDDESGMSLVEIMIAVFVLSVGLLALASTAITSIVSLRVSKVRQEATDAASALIEDLRRTDYSLVALDANDPDVTALGDCTSGSDPEPIVTTSQPGAIPYQQTFGPSGRVTLTTTVSWFDEPESGDQACTDTSHDKRVRRVQVVAEWTDGDQTYSLQESTLVAPVDRGLPAPDFRLGTPDASVTFMKSDLSTGRERCVGHVLRNLGAADGYEWTAKRTDSGSVEKSNAARYWTSDGKFFLRAFFENPAQETPLDPSQYNVPKDQVDRHANLPAELELLVDGADGNVLPETESQLGTGEQARMWICYWTGSNAKVGDSIEFAVTVSSQFDPNRTETVNHIVEITDTFHDWYFYDDDTSDAGQDSARALTRPNGTKYLPVLPMGSETSLQPERLGTASPLPNYDTDLDDEPGTRLRATSEFPDANRIVFHQQVNTATTFKPTIDLSLWLASEDAIDALQAGSSSTPSHSLRLLFTLQVLDKNENKVQSTVFQDLGWTHDHTTVGWDELALRFNLGSAFTVQDGEYLRWSITCDESNSTDECHVAYDNTTLDSYLRMWVQS